MSPNPALLTWPRPVAGGGSIEATYRGNAVTTATTGPFTLNLPIGDASADRTVIVGMTFRRGLDRTITSATIGGISASVDYAPPRGGWQHLAFLRATVPTGTTADVVVEINGDIANHGLRMASWTCDGAAAVVDTDTGSGSTVNMSIDADADGFVLGIAGHANGTGLTWTGTTEDFDITSGTTRLSGATANGASGTLTPQAAFSGSPIDPAAAVIAYRPA